jgi:ABC-type transport system substrate-binding protein
MRHLVRVSVVVLPAAALAAGCTSAPGHPAAQAPSSSSAAAQPATSSAAGPVPTTAVPAASTHLGPAATVRAYYRAINNHNYARAWHLGGRFTGSS